MKPIWSGHGFVTPFIQPEEWLFGAIALHDKPLRPIEGWRKFLPLFESQNKNGIELYNCTAFGTLNALETLQLVKYGEKVNYSDRLLGVMAGTRPPGNNPHIVMETLREGGVASEELHPWNGESVNDYYDKGRIPSRAVSEARKWLRAYSSNHQWLFTPFYQLEEKQENLMRSLEHSPIGISVYAWWKNGILHQKPEGAIDNHWCVLFDYEKGHYWTIYDSYEDEVKLLDWNYDFEFAKLITLEKKEAKRCFLMQWFD